jgi:eukaryotic-like serine/threonine-protein kinase
MLPAPEPTAPDQFGPYEVFERLGIGGMATVHRAKKHGPAGFERSVALKRMLSHLAEDASFVESFIREAKVASILAHPNIAQTYDFGRIGGIYYIAMELVPGFDVRKLLRYANRANESIPLAVVLSILGELCDALEYAHAFVDEHGQALKIVHRDISPSNMIVAHTGHLKVIDFGIAKASSRQLHTESGQVKGKLGYMAPEVALGVQVEPVSDIFSAGVVGWELITASPLFSSRTDFETMRRIREGDIVAPSGRNPSCPPDLDRLILQALEREPGNRLKSAGSFRRGLDAVAAKLGVQAGPRAVAEWIRQFVQPEDYLRFSGGQLPQDAPTSQQRPSNRAKLQRSEDERALATEIWGDDQGPTAASDGPDFSVALNDVPSRMSISLPQPAPRAPSSSPPHVHRISTPMPTQMPPSSLVMAPPVPQLRPNRTGIFLVLGLAIVAAVLLAIFLLKPSSKDTQVADKLALPDKPPPALAPTPVEPAPAPTVAPPPTPAPAPPPTPAPAPTKHPATTRRPVKSHATPRHEEHAEQHVEPAPEPTPPPVVAQPVTPPPTVPTPPEPAKPARTPVVSATAVAKISGELPTIKGENNGDVLVKMCIDEQGKVTSVKVVKATAEMPPDLTHALESWRYKPYLNKDQKPSPVCFALSLRVVVKRAD